MPGLEVVSVAGILLVVFFGIRGVYRRLSLTRQERAFLSLAAKRGLERRRAMDFVRLARAKGTTAMEEANSVERDDLQSTRQQARIAVMGRAARDEQRRLLREADPRADINAINDAADAAGIAMLNLYVAPGGALAADSPMGVAALRALIEKCNEDLKGVPESARYRTQMGPMAPAGVASRK